MFIFLSFFLSCLIPLPVSLTTSLWLLHDLSVSLMAISFALLSLFSCVDLFEIWFNLPTFEHLERYRIAWGIWELFSTSRALQFVCTAWKRHWNFRNLTSLSLRKSDVSLSYSTSELISKSRLSWCVRVRISADLHNHSVPPHNKYQGFRLGYK